MTVDILGTKYEVLFKDYDDQREFKDNSWDGFCDGVLKKIIVGNLKTFPGCEKETDEYCVTSEKQTLRHEIVHAFLNESGLKASSLSYEGGWARNEEMVDWIANQFPKMLEVFQKANCL